MSRNFGVILRQHRLRAGLTQRALARQVGVAPETLSHYEVGRLPVPPDVAVAIARSLQNRCLLEAYCHGCPITQAQKGVA